MIPGHLRYLATSRANWLFEMKGADPTTGPDQVPPSRLELEAPSLVGRCSIQLSYEGKRDGC
jgi:hypothetical protein